MKTNGDLLSAHGITKVFPGVVALDNVSLSLRRGEILALVGENGAGKTTLIKIISGVFAPTAGSLHIRGERIDDFHPSRSLELGVSTIYQQFNLVLDLSVASNIMLGREPRTFGGYLVDFKRMSEMAAEHLGSIGVSINPETKVRDLGVSGRQMVEIAKALSAQSEILIMDEPTSALTQAEIPHLFEIMRRLRERGVGIIFVSHRLEEIKEISDRIVVLRDGKKVAETDTKETGVSHIVHLMIGETLSKHTRAHRDIPDHNILEVTGLSTRGKFSNISFTVRKSEVVGLTGLLGSGTSDVAHALVGFEPIDKGEVLVEGEKIAFGSGLEAGIGLVPEDRQHLGVILPLSVQDNICTANQAALSRYGLRDKRRERELTERYASALDIKCASYAQEVMYLSGGNQQKVVIAKWLARKPKMLIMDQPTHGIDVKTKAEIAAIIRELADEGIGILLISTEIDELLDLCDRVLVLHEGRLVDEMSSQEASKERIKRSSMGLVE